MRVWITFRTPEILVNEVFEGADADAVVFAMQHAAAARSSFGVRLLINALSPLQFARQVVSRYNAAMGRSLPEPRSCAEFLDLGQAEGIARFDP